VPPRIGHIAGPLSRHVSSLAQRDQLGVILVPKINIEFAAVRAAPGQLGPEDAKLAWVSLAWLITCTTSLCGRFATATDSVIRWRPSGI
jgi:hypothetical protein